MCDLTPSNLMGTSMGFLSTVMDVGQTLGPIVSGIILATAAAYTGLYFIFDTSDCRVSCNLLFSGIAEQKSKRRHSQVSA
jgi:sugar phosphate permease